MKKRSILKAILISFLIFIGLTWIVKVGSYSGGAFELGEVAPYGIYDLVKIGLGIFGNFAVYGIIFLLIGALYGVMNKTGVYSTMVEKLKSKFAKKEQRFLIISVILFALLGSLSGFNIALFIIVPFFMTVILSLGYDKLTAVLATAGSIIVGNIGATYAFEIDGYLNLYYALGTNDKIFEKIIFIVALTLLTILFVTMNAKAEKVTTKKATKKVDTKSEKTSKTKKDKEEKEVIIESKVDIPLYQPKEVNKKKSFVPLAVLLTVTFLITVLGVYNYSYAFNFKVFENIHTSITEFNINGYTLFANILGSISPFGSWGLGEIGFILLVACFVFGWIYNLKFKEIIKAMEEGIKEMVPVAIIAILASIIMYLVLPSSSTGLHANIFITMHDWIMNLTKGFNWFTTGAATFLGSFFYNDFKYLVDATASNVITTQTDPATYPAISLMYQALHGLVMLFAPVSIVMMAALTYMKVSYKEWLGYIWKFLLQLLVLIILFITIVVVFI